MADLLSLPIEIWIKIMWYLPDDRDKLSICGITHGMTRLKRYVDFHSWVQVEYVRHLDYFHAFTKVQACIGTTFLPNGTKMLRLVAAQPLPGACTRKSYNIDSLPITLHTLVISLISARPPSYKLKFGNLAMLNLTRLDVDVATLRHIVKSWPQNVTHVVCRFVHQSSTQLADLRKTQITHLRLHSSVTCMVYIHCNVTLPETLTHFAKYRNVGLINKNKIYNKNIISWQTADCVHTTNLVQMTQLQKLSTVGDVISDALSQHIRKIVCWHFVLSANWLGRHLHTLGVKKCDTIDVAIMPCLQRLLVVEFGQIHNLAQHQLLSTLILGQDVTTEYPPNLRHLQIPSNLKSTPSGLTHLSITHLVENLVVPLSVTHLQLRIRNPKVKITFGDNLEVLSIGPAVIPYLRLQGSNLSKLHTLHLSNGKIHRYNINPVLKTNYDYLTKVRDYVPINHNASDTESEDDIDYDELSTFAPDSVSDVYVEPELNISLGEYHKKVHYLDTRRSIVSTDFQVWQ